MWICLILKNVSKTDSLDMVARNFFYFWNTTALDIRSQQNQIQS